MRWRVVATWLVALAIGCDAAPTLEWSVAAGSGVDADSIEFVQARITRGACAEAGEVVWSGEARRDGGGATFSSPGNLGAGTWCFAAVGGASDCAEIATGEVERILPDQREPFEVVLSPSPGPCVPVLDAGLPDGGLDGATPMEDAGPPGPVLCWPSPLPESPPPLAEPTSEVYRTLRLPLEDPEFCPTSFSDARRLWGDSLCAELVGRGFNWSDGRPFDECVEAARYFEPSLGGGIELLKPISRPNEFMDYRACNVSYFMGEPSNATGSPVRECLPNTPTNPVTLLCERPSQGTVEVDPLATVGWSSPSVVLGRNYVAAAYDPDADRYLVVYGRGDAIWWVFVGAYGEVGTPALLAGEEGVAYRYPRVAVGETEAGETRFAVLWEEDGMRTGGPQLFVVLDGEGAPLIEPTYIVDPEMHEFWNNESELAVGYERGRHAFLFAGLAARQSEEDYVRGKLQLRRARVGGEDVELEAPFQLESDTGAEGFFSGGAMRVVHHPTRGETVVQVGTELLVFPEGAESPRTRRVVEELGYDSELVPVEGSDRYLAAFGSQVGWLDGDLGLRDSMEWTRRSRPSGLLHFPADRPGAMAGTALVQSGDGRLRYLTEGAEPCYPTSAWREGPELSILVRNTDTGGFARFTVGDDSGLFATVFLSNGVRY